MFETRLLIADLSTEIAPSRPINVFSKFQVGFGLGKILFCLGFFILSRFFFFFFFFVCFGFWDIFFFFCFFFSPPFFFFFFFSSHFHHSLAAALGLSIPLFFLPV